MTFAINYRKMKNPNVQNKNAKYQIITFRELENGVKCWVNVWEYL